MNSYGELQTNPLHAAQQSKFSSSTPLDISRDTEQAIDVNATMEFNKGRGDAYIDDIDADDDVDMDEDEVSPPSPNSNLLPQTAAAVRLTQAYTCGSVHPLCIHCIDHNTGHLFVPTQDEDEDEGEGQEELDDDVTAVGGDIMGVGPTMGLVPDDPTSNLGPLGHDMTAALLARQGEGVRLD
jgi:hypothetical protein